MAKVRKSTISKIQESIVKKEQFLDGTDDNRIVKQSLNDLEKILSGEICEQEKITEIIDSVTKSISVGLFDSSELKDEILKRLGNIKKVN